MPDISPSNLGALLFGDGQHSVFRAATLGRTGMGMEPANGF